MSHFVDEPDDYLGPLFEMSETEFDAWAKEVGLDEPWPWEAEVSTADLMGYYDIGGEA
jgi:hypothetical protein